MAVLLDDFVTQPGEHCGSTAMRNLIRYYCGLELTEAEVLGLGSGVDFILLEGSSRDVPFLPLGRGVTMETDAANALGIDYTEQPDPDDGHAWEAVRDEVAAGRPTMLSGDAYYLDYRDFRVHFPSHRFVLVGFDDDRRVATVADRMEAKFDECSYDALAASRNPPEGISTLNLWGRFGEATALRPLEEAYRTALRRSAARMLGTDSSQRDLLMLLRGGRTPVRSGLDALGYFAERLPEWRERPDVSTAATQSAATMEKYGTGGGNFRVLYAAFLERATVVTPDLVTAEDVATVRRAAAGWAVLADALTRIGESAADDAAWQDARGAVADVLVAETELFERLGERTET